MSEIDRLFNLLHAALTGSKADASPYADMEASEWWSLFRLLQHNHVAALASEALDETVRPPRDIYMPWIAEREKAVKWYGYQNNVEQELRQRWQRHGIECLTLKGTHMAQYYRVPELREFGDLDLYFYDRHAEADEVVSRELGVTVSSDAHHHTKYNYRGVTIESHFDFINSHTPPSNRRYEQLLKSLAPSPTFEVLFLLRHMAGHFASARITLRDLCDWHCLCSALGQQADWQQVSTTVSDYGMEPFTAALCTLCNRRFGSHIPLDFSCSEELTRRIEHDIIYGNATAEFPADGLARLTWKLRRYRANRWKQPLVFNDSRFALLLSSLTAHVEKPRSIMHKM